MAQRKRRRGGSKKASAAAAKKRRKSEISVENELPQEEEELGKEIETVVVEEIEEIPADPPVVPSIPVEPPVNCGKASSTAKNGEKLGNEIEISTENVLTQEEEEVGEVIETVVEQTLEPVLSADPPLVDLGSYRAPITKLPWRRAPKSDPPVVIVDLDSGSAPITKLPCRRAPKSEQIREDQVQNGIKFLSHPKVRGFPVMYMRYFLEKKGLSREEIDETFRRVLDPPPPTTTMLAAFPNQGGDSHVRDVSSGQQQLCEDRTEVEVVDCTQDDNKEKGKGGSEHMESSAVKHTDTCGRKVDLTESFVCDQVFDSCGALIEWCQEVGRKTMCVVVVTKSSKPVLGKPAMLELGCERGGVHQDHKNKTDTPALIDLTKKRESRPRKCGCPFALEGVWMEGDKWKVRVHCGAHNHELPETLVGHSDVARLKEDEKEIVDLTKSGVRHRRVLSSLKHRPKENMSRMRTIYNYNASAAIKLTEVERKSAMHTASSVNVSTMKTVENASAAIKPTEVEGNSVMHTSCSVNVSTMETVENASAVIKLIEVEGKAAMQQLPGLLLKHHYVEWHRRDEKSDELKDIFWAHPESLQLVLGFHSVLIVDCTYKTNRFGSPLLRIAAVTSTGKLFTVAFIFMDAETEDHYVWALTRLKRLFSPNALPSTFVTDGELKLVNAIGTVFPQAKWLFCSLHVVKKVSENCKQYFESNEEFERFMKDWKHLTQVRTKDEYAEAFCDFVLTWTSYPACIQYLRDNWLRHKDHYVLAWTKLIKHFGNTKINRVGSSEGSDLKGLLAYSNISTCWTLMHQMICDELIDIKASFENSLISVPHEYLLPAFEELRGFVSHKAMELLLLEHSRSRDVGFNVEVCGCVLRLSYGLPCAHEIVQCCRNGTGIRLSEIDSQWKLLSVIPVPEEHSEFDYLPELILARKRWEKASKSEREIMQKKLEEIASL